MNHEKTNNSRILDFKSLVRWSLKDSRNSKSHQDILVEVDLDPASVHEIEAVEHVPS